MYFFFFFFNDTATTEIYTLSLHDALPIWVRNQQPVISRCHTPSGGDRLSFIRGIDLPSSRRETPPVYRSASDCPTSSRPSGLPADPCQATPGVHASSAAARRLLPPSSSWTPGSLMC